MKRTLRHIPKVALFFALVSTGLTSAHYGPRKKISSNNEAWCRAHPVRSNCAHNDHPTSLVSNPSSDAGDSTITEPRVTNKSRRLSEPYASPTPNKAVITNISSGGVGYVTFERLQGVNSVITGQIGRWDTPYPNPSTGIRAPGLEPDGVSYLYWRSRLKAELQTHF